MQFCIFFVYLKFGPMNFFYQQALGRAQIYLTVQQILGNFIKGNAIDLARKISIFLSRKTLRNGIELRQDLYLRVRKLSNL